MMEEPKVTWQEFEKEALADLKMAKDFGLNKSPLLDLPQFQVIPDYSEMAKQFFSPSLPDLVAPIMQLTSKIAEAEWRAIDDVAMMIVSQKRPFVYFLISRINRIFFMKVFRFRMEMQHHIGFGTEIKICKVFSGRNLLGSFKVERKGADIIITKD